MGVFETELCPQVLSLVIGDSGARAVDCKGNYAVSPGLLISETANVWTEVIRALCPMLYASWPMFF
jgi:hypothetical protein